MERDLSSVIAKLSSEQAQKSLNFSDFCRYTVINEFLFQSFVLSPTDIKKGRALEKEGRKITFQHAI